jgi:hypothetical protein
MVQEEKDAIPALMHLGISRPPYFLEGVPFLTPHGRFCRSPEDSSGLSTRPIEIESRHWGPLFQ